MTHKENITAILECYFTGFKDEIIESACNRILEQEPTRTGYWVKTPKPVMGDVYMWYCDKCEHQVYQNISKDYPSEKYCPNCGAKMEETETWNSMHGQITVPKGTFERIFNDADDNDI